MQSTSRLRLFLLLLCMTIESLSLNAQRALIKGVVVDSNSKPLANATVYALIEQDMTKPVLVKADENGEFIFENLPPGIVYLDAEKKVDGYPYSLFSFYISPGQDKPRLDLKAGETLNNVVIRMGERVAYLKITFANVKGEDLSPGFHFARPDIPDHRGDLGLTTSVEDPIPVPAVPFSFEIKVHGYKTWKYHSPGNNDLVSLKPGQELKLNVELTADPKGRD